MGNEPQGKSLKENMAWSNSLPEKDKINSIALLRSLMHLAIDSYFLQCQEEGVDQLSKKTVNLIFLHEADGQRIYQHACFPVKPANTETPTSETVN